MYWIVPPTPDIGIGCIGDCSEGCLIVCIQVCGLCNPNYKCPGFFVPCGTNTNHPQP